MHEIKFRGKRSNDNEWIYGNLVNINNSYHILSENDMVEDGHHIRQDSDVPTWVDKDTIGQFTSLKDMKGNDIYEGDLLKANDGVIYEVWYSEIIGCFVIKMVNHKNDWADILGNYYTEECFEAIGNIYDNKELLKEMEDKND